MARLCIKLNRSGRQAPIAQMADIGFKVVLLERLNQKWKQKQQKQHQNK